MKNLVALILIVSGMTMTLSAQDGGRAYFPDDLQNKSEIYEMPRADQVGPLCNPPIFPMPNFIRAFIDPMIYNLVDAMLPYKYDYRPYVPGQKRSDISATLPKKKEC